MIPLHAVFPALVVDACLVGASPPLHASSLPPSEPVPLKLLFLGDSGHHRPYLRFRQLQPAFERRGIDLHYTDSVAALDGRTLAGFDGLILYANIERIAPEQERALLDFVAGGKGFVPLHCASYCFHNSPAFIALVGAQFRSHGVGVFRTETAPIDHPILKGFESFSSWDETYVHARHNEENRTVLEYRVGNGAREPWTWVRTHGKGRVFYTAWGHDHRTWCHPGFQNLVERGVRWACGRDVAETPAYVDRPQMTAARTDLQPIEYVPAKVPFYPAGERWGTTSEPIPRMPKPLSVEESMKRFITPVGFEVAPFAAEDRLEGKPIAMAWDERGRLYVALTVDYPNELQPPGAGRDRIVLCEDIDGDGRCDRVTTFADKLSIPTSVLPFAGGLIVHQAPVTLFLKDATGDGVADVRQVLLEGWGTSDTHAGPSNLRYGLDNWIYGMVGYSGFSGTVAGEKHDFRQGFFRFKVETEGGDGRGIVARKLEFLRSTSNNSWGVGFSEEGLLFGSTANGCPSVFSAIPNRDYEAVKGIAPRVLESIALENRFHPVTREIRQVDYHGGFTAAAGHAIYTARTYPPEYWNRTAFVCEPTGHLVAAFVLQPSGAGFVARYGWNLLASFDEWSAPIVAEVGPDGNVWVIDWYNYIVQHNPTPTGFRTGKGNAYETPLRDKKHGRIYRIVHKSAERSPTPDLANADVARLIQTLGHPNMLWRLHAQRLLVERRAVDAAESLANLVIRTGSTPSEDAAAVHALGALCGMGAFENPEAKSPAVASELARSVLSAGLSHRFAAVRLRALEAAAGWEIQAEKLLDDVDPLVRLAAALNLAREPRPRPAAGAAIAELFFRRDAEASPAIADAATIAAARHPDGFLNAVLRAKSAATGPETLRAASIAAANLPTRSPNALSALLVALADAAPQLMHPIAEGLAANWPSNASVQLGPAGADAIGRMLEHGTPAVRASLARLAGALGIQGLEKHLRAAAAQLLAEARDVSRNPADRIDAVRQLVQFDSSDASMTAVLDAMAAESDAAMVSGMLGALSLHRSPALGPKLLERMKSLPASARPAAVGLLLSRPDSTVAFLDAIEKGTARFDWISLDRQAALSSHPDARIAERARRLRAQGGGLPDPNRQKVIESLAGAIAATGNPGPGKALFIKHCAKCHKHGSEGAAVGPDLTGMAVHPKEELAVHILDPNRSVEGNYRAYVAELGDGRILTGLLSSQTRTTVELVDAEAKRHVLERSDIETLRETEKSLMPEGFEKEMTAAELTDLLEFLTQKGKYLPIPLERYATVTSVRGMFNDERAEPERLIFRDWSPKTFADVPFYLVDPRAGAVRNAVMLKGAYGKIPPRMPESVSLPCNTPAKAIHLLSGVGGWSYPATDKGSVSMIVRLHYADGQVEDHELLNGVHFADYIRRVDVPASQFAFRLRGQQIRYLSVAPKRSETILQIEFVKGPDPTAPVVMAVTVERP